MGKGKDGRTPSPPQIRGCKHREGSSVNPTTAGSVFADGGSDWKGVYLLPDLDGDAFKADLHACVAAVGPPTGEDAAHFKRIVNIMYFCSVGGHLLLFATALEHAEPWGPNSALLSAMAALISACLISTGRTMNWVVVAITCLTADTTNWHMTTLSPPSIGAGTMPPVSGGAAWTGSTGCYLRRGIWSTTSCTTTSCPKTPTRTASSATSPSSAR